jgi:ABC-type polysaccharide/polyol phosphate transport system ATPase subunit
MSELAIQAVGLGKKYLIGDHQKAFDRIGDQLLDLVVSPFRRAGRLLRGQASGAAELDKTFWALQDVNFEIMQGDVVGIIGHNGAGKSTLLKILSRITDPTTGYAAVYGRISSLLEVGTGFHPELTGRENIYLNGAILGMRKTEIDSKFDAIVDFAEIDEFIDTPVKFYSSGMYVRLAFSVAAHLEPEILLVDEVLAVGDIAFQKKCLGKMDSVSRQGRTVIFVSHNMNALQRLCPQSIMLSRGQVVTQGKTATVIQQYLSTETTTLTQPGSWIDMSELERDGTGEVQFSAISYNSFNEKTGGRPYANGLLQFSLDIFAQSDKTVDSLAVTLYDQYGTKLINADTLALVEALHFNQGSNIIDLTIKELNLNPGIYTLGLWIANPPSQVFDSLPSTIRIEVVEHEPDQIRVPSDGLVTCRFELSQNGKEKLVTVNERFKAASTGLE